MSNHLKRRNEPSERFDDGAAQRWITDAIRHKLVFCSTSLSDAQCEVAEEIGVSRWTVVNIYRGRVKALRGALRDAIQRHKITFLESQIAALDRELALTKGLAPPLTDTQRANVVVEIATARLLVAQMRELLEDVRKR